ncbi:MAG: hypothetical protein IJ551_05160 [Prevotella sp.]|nr:hypothetical protein [Prevotella sp.]
MADTGDHAAADRHELPGIAQDRCQLTGLGVQRGVEDEVAPVTLIDAVLDIAAGEEKWRE